MAEMAESIGGDLPSEEELHRWADEISPSLWENAVRLEQVESWALDRNAPLFARSLGRLMRLLRERGRETLFNSREDLIILMRALAFTHTRQALYMMSKATEGDPGFPERFIELSAEVFRKHGEFAREAGVGLGRLDVLNAYDIYERMFGTKARTEVLEILREEIDEDYESF